MAEKGKQIEVKYGVLLESSYSVIYKGYPYNFYDLKEPALSEEEKNLAETLIAVLQKRTNFFEIKKLQIKGIDESFADTIRENILSDLDIESVADTLPNEKFTQHILNNLENFIKEKAPFSKHPETLAQHVVENSIGYGKLAKLLIEENIEEIMINAAREEVFIFHRKYGMCKTNILMNVFLLKELLNRIAKSVGKTIDEENPLLDAHLPDGSRINATSNYVTPEGNTLTIRRFSKVPLSIINMVQSKTISSELAAFLWVGVEGLAIYPLNIIFAGGTGSGKTTLLNICASFIPLNERLITIEDTLELDLGSRENWIKMEAKHAKKDMAEITMNDLLINSLRMRPDRLIVGEVRGKEAETLFVAMDTGHQGAMGTLHANTPREALVRLKSNPMNVPESMLPLLDLIIVQKRIFSRQRGMLRRVSQVAEVTRMEDQVLLANLFEWDMVKDELKKTDVPSHLIEVLAEKTSQSKKEVMKEIAVRQKIIDFLIQKNITNIADVQNIVQQYYQNPEQVIKLVMPNQA